MRRIVLCVAHSILEYDNLRLWTEIGHEVFSLGAYIDPAHPLDDKRPPISAPAYPELKAAVDALSQPDNLEAAQKAIPDAVLDWADTIIYHTYLERLYGQWDRIRDWKQGDSNRRVIWATVGQSGDYNEYIAAPFRAEGMEIVRYSPKERVIPYFAGEDALIRFYKDPDEWCGWTGEDSVVITVSQGLKQRDPFTNYGFWQKATEGLPSQVIGPGSEAIGGAGPISYPQMQQRLRTARAYLYTGTQPASYTLGLIEAMMTGVPVVSIGPSWMQLNPWGSELFEAHEIVGPLRRSDDPAIARKYLQELLERDGWAPQVSHAARNTAIELFGKQKIKAEWAAYLR